MARELYKTVNPPFEMPEKLEKPTCIDGMTDEEIRAEIEKGVWSLEHERTYTPEEVGIILNRLFGI